MKMGTRAVLYGGAAGLVLSAVLCAIFVGGRTGAALSIACGALGGIGLISLVFLEVGLSEDRERRLQARERASKPVDMGARRLVARRNRPRR